LKLLSISRAFVLAMLGCALPALASDNAAFEQPAPPVCRLDLAALTAPACTTAKPR